MSIDHPHIIKGRGVIYSKKESKFAIYLVLDYMLELPETLKKNPDIYKDHLNLKILAYHILLGLDHLHSHMILHRDLKP